MFKKQKVIISCRAVIILILLCFFSSSSFAATPKTIKIGLESVYKDAKSITISSDYNLSVGYLEDDHFNRESELNTNRVTIIRTTEDFYFTGSAYHTLKEAKNAAAALGNGAVAACMDEGTYCVYTKNNTGSLLTAPASANRLAVYNEDNNLILINDSNTSPFFFQGLEKGYDFPVTQVGSLRQYRGAVGAVCGQAGGITAVNLVNIEDYLYGVVPVEMAPGWPIEALKAQAVAARSIAYFQYNRFVSKGYNLVDTTVSQVYKGFSAESANSNQAVDETKGEVIKYNNQVAEALYFSTSGGTTEDAKYVWGNEVPYFKTVVDKFETEPAQKPWVRTIPLSELSSCLAKQSINIGQLKGVEISSRTPSGRVLTLTLIGSEGTYVVKNENTRTFFSGTKEGSLKSRLFSFSSAAVVPAGEAADQKVTVMSENNVVQKSIAGAKVISAGDRADVPENPVIQSAETTKTVADESGSGLNLGTQKETIFGDLVIYGQGFGHGLGMSQSGAKGMAKAGYNYQDILTYYYNGVTVER